MTLFEVSEILQFALRIEENGEKIYREFSKTMEGNNVKKLFSYLADEEVKHKKTFEDMVSKVEKYEPPESYPGEYFAYLRAYVDNTIFTHKNLDKELAKVKDAITAIEFSIRREIDSILYYLEMKNFVQKDQHNAIYKIIDEERRHYLKLTELKKNCEVNYG